MAAPEYTPFPQWPSGYHGRDGWTGILNSFNGRTTAPFIAASYFQNEIAGHPDHSTDHWFETFYQSTLVAFGTHLPFDQQYWMLRRTIAPSHESVYESERFVGTKSLHTIEDFNHPDGFGYGWREEHISIHDEGFRFRVHMPEPAFVALLRFAERRYWTRHIKAPASGPLYDLSFDTGRYNEGCGQLADLPYLVVMEAFDPGWNLGNLFVAPSTAQLNCCYSGVPCDYESPFVPALDRRDFVDDDGFLRPGPGHPDYSRREFVVPGRSTVLRGEGLASR